MGRIARVVIPGCWHHVTQRGNRRQTVFFDNADRKLYLDLLHRYCSRYEVAVTGYCLMSNHVHIIAVPAHESSLARAFGVTNNDCARWQNARRLVNGHLWQNRYFSCPLDEAHRWEALRYVELNPVRAAMVSAPEEWPWSSAQAHLGGRDNRGLLDTTAWEACWSADGWRERLAEGLTDPAMAQRIRDATRTGRPVGDDAFLDHAEACSGRRLRPAKRGPKPPVFAGEAQLNFEVV